VNEATGPVAKPKTALMNVGVSTVIVCPASGCEEIVRVGKLIRLLPATVVTGPRRVTSAAR
jgi:hypothetical protein